MSRAVAEADVFAWADGFLAELDAVSARRLARRSPRVAPTCTGTAAAAQLSRRHAIG